MTSATLYEVRCTNRLCPKAVASGARKRQQIATVVIRGTLPAGVDVGVIGQCRSCKQIQEISVAP